MTKTILITGGTGLLGTALCDVIEESSHLLKDDDTRLVLASSEDFSDKLDSSKRDEYDYVIHCAAKVGGLFGNMNDNIGFYYQNVEINGKVHKFCAQSKTVRKVISCLSTCIFPDGIPLPLTVDKLHNGLPHFSNLGYSMSKRMLDVQNKLHHTPEIPFVGVIPCNMFGFNDNYDEKVSHVVPALILKCWKAKQTGVDLNMKGSGSAKRQFVFSQDVAKIIYHLLASYNDVEPVIIAPREEYTIRQVIYIIADKMDYKGKISFESDQFCNADGQLQKTADGSRIDQLVPEFAFTPFDIALEKTIDDFSTRLGKGTLRGFTL